MTKAEILTALRQSGLASLVDRIASRIWPSIRLDTQPVDLAGLQLGASRIGGVPDLSQGVEWPRRGSMYLPFIAQIRLSDLRELDRDMLLPPTGWLCFFYDAVNQPWGYDPAQREGWKVLYFDGPDTSLRRSEAPPLPEQGTFQACSVTPEAEYTLPDSSALITEGVLEHMNDEFHGYFELVDKCARERVGCQHRVLGNPDVIQGEMRLACQFASNGLYCGDPSVRNDPRARELAKGATDWVLLLQIDTDQAGPGWMWGDCGRLFCWIRSQDLAQHDFNHVWAVLQCY